MKRFFGPVIFQAAAVLMITLSPNAGIVVPPEQVNENKGVRTQESVSVCYNAVGRHAIAWCDRTHDSIPQIYYRVYAADNLPLGEEKRVAPSKVAQYDPCLAMNDSGYVLTSWIENTTGGQTRFVKIIGPDGTAADTTIAISSAVVMRATYSFSMDSRRNWIVGCVSDNSYSSDDPDVMLAYYSASLKKFNSAGAVNSDKNYNLGKGNAQVVLDNSGNAVIMWAAVSMHTDNFIQAVSCDLSKFDSTGDFTRCTFNPVMDIISNVVLSKVTGLGNGKCAAVWVDTATVAKSIYCMNFQCNQLVTDTVYKITSAGGTKPAIAIDTSGNTIVSWLAQGVKNGKANIMAAVVNKKSGIVTPAIKVNTIDTSATDQMPVVVATSGGFKVLWLDTRLLGTDVFQQNINTAGVCTGENSRIGVWEGKAQVWSPHFIFCPDKSQLILWVDARRGNANCDIFCQAYETSGHPLGKNVLVSDDSHRKTAGNIISVAQNKAGGALVVWTDSRSLLDSTDVFGQFFNGTSRNGANFKISQDTGKYITQAPRVDAMSNGSFLVSWIVYRATDLTSKISARIVMADGTMKKDFIVSGDRRLIKSYSVCVDSIGTSTFVWADSGAGSLWLTRFDSAGICRDPAAQIGPPSVKRYYLGPTLINNPLSGQILVWCDAHANLTGKTEYGIYARKISNTGLSAEMQLPEDSSTLFSYSLSLVRAKPNGEVMIFRELYDTKSTTSNYFMQLYTKDLERSGPVKEMQYKTADIGLYTDTLWTVGNLNLYTIVRCAQTINDISIGNRWNTFIPTLADIVKFNIGKSGPILNLRFNAKHIGTAKFTIYQLNGKVLLNKKITVSRTGPQAFRISAASHSIPAGTYICQLDFAGKVDILRLNVNQ